ALVVRCPHCAGVLLRYANSGHRLRLDLTGARLLTVTLPPNGPDEGTGVAPSSIGIRAPG
ncbi:MAG: DUF6510 family protein, partial [Actinomycetota bacterium]|nr:DUF6510 family protein [Actinomycetota bacterium]